jgi:hypothetical protein
MKTLFITFVLLFVVFIGQITFAQFNPEKPELCQGKFYTEAPEIDESLNKILSPIMTLLEKKHLK